jgi:RHS repeat-associated protein
VRYDCDGVDAGGGSGGSPICPFVGDCYPASVPDGAVNGSDVTCLIANYHKPGTWFEGDFDGNGYVDNNDVQVQIANYGLNTRTIYRSWEWSLDALGNWAGYTQIVDLDGDGVDTNEGDSLLQQTRTHNKVNEIDNDDDHTNTPSGSITGGSWVLPVHDAAGNMTRAPRPGQESTAAEALLTVYDAWNRPAKVYKDSNANGSLDVGTDALVAEYRYDGRGWRIAKILPDPGHANKYLRTDYYYNESWQTLEERTNDNLDSGDTVATAVKVQWLWDIRYIDAPVLRWRDADSNSENGLEETLYYCNDANMNVTALVNASSGTVVERYVYDPYGKATIYDDDWSDTISWDNSKKNEILYCGYRWDPETGMYQVRNREYHPTMGRWVSRDPQGYASGLLRDLQGARPTLLTALYLYGEEGPLTGSDPLGTDWVVMDPRGAGSTIRDVTSGKWVSKERFAKNLAESKYTPKQIDFYKGMIAHALLEKATGIVQSWLAGTIVKGYSDIVTMRNIYLACEFAGDLGKPNQYGEVKRDPDGNAVIGRVRGLAAVEVHNSVKDLLKEAAGFGPPVPFEFIPWAELTFVVDCTGEAHVNYWTNQTAALSVGGESRTVRGMIVDSGTITRGEIICACCPNRRAAGR